MIYLYTCNVCKIEWEEEQKMSDPRIEICPKCNKKEAKRLISGGTSFVLKGGSWAKDNYK